MTAAPPRSFPSAYSLPRVEHGSGGAQKSRSKVFTQSSCVVPGPQRGVSARDLAAAATHQRARHLAALRQAGIGGEGFRIWFAPAFARWLQINFRDAETVAVTFGVRYQTALNWWNAAHRASGDTVALVFMSFPHAVAWFLAEWGAEK